MEHGLDPGHAMHLAEDQDFAGLLGDPRFRILVDKGKALAERAKTQ